MHAAFDPALTSLMVGIASIGWWASLELSRRAPSRRDWQHQAPWLVAASGSLGLAIWSMQLVGLLSPAAGEPVGSDAALSLSIAVLSPLAGLALAARQPIGARFALASLAMGIGLCGSTLVEAGVLHGAFAAGDLRSILLPAITATAVSSVALALDRGDRRPLVRAVTVLLLGLASATLLARGARPAGLDAAAPAASGWLATGAVCCTVLISATGLLAALFDRRLEQLAARTTRLVRQNEEQLQRVLEQLPFGIIVADVSTGAVVFSNHEAGRVLGELKRENRPTQTFFPSNDAIGDPLTRALRDEETVDRELQVFRRRDSGQVTLEISAAPIYDERRRMLLAIAAFQDVSARVQAEADLRQAQKMDAIGQLTGGIAHDTNNLLTAILGNLDLLEPRLADEQQRALLRNALSATERGAKLTSQLLGFSRRQSLAPSTVDVNRAVADMHPLLASTLGGTIQIACVLGQDLWPAYADATQLELVLLNLSINARDAMPSGGAIHIVTENAVLSDRLQASDPPPGEYVMLTVRDTGTGMSRDTLARAFEPFFTTKGPGRGSGLGLAQVLGIAQQLGGGVRIASEPGRGTAVQLFMPRSLAAVEAAPVSPVGSGRTSALHGKTILLVDDDDDVRSAARALLAQFGCIVIEEDNGRSAVARVAAAERIDIVLIDFAMPGLTGADAGERMRAIRPNLPILVITGYADPDQLPGVEGRFPTLQKPFRGAQLAELLPTLLSASSQPATPPQTSVVSLRARRNGRESVPPLQPFSQRDIG